MCIILTQGVPNDRLTERMAILPGRFTRRNTMIFMETFETFRLKLWDEQSGRMVAFPKPQSGLYLAVNPLDARNIMTPPGADEQAVLNSP